MQASTRALLNRGGAVCAAAVVLLGGTMNAATAADVATPTATSSATASASPEASALAPGLDEALARDLGITVEEFNEQGQVATAAATVEAEVKKVDPNAVVTVDADSITVSTEAGEEATAAATAVAGETPVTVETKAAPAAPTHAANVDALFNDYVAAFGTKNLQSIMVDANGAFVIRTADVAIATQSPSARAFATPSAAPLSTGEFAAKYGNVEVKYADGPAKAANNLTDAVGGQGILAAFSETQLGSCSLGFNAFSATGEPAGISAGHCTGDDSVLPGVALSDPLTDPANGGEGFDATVRLGTWGFSQFGGPGNSPAVIPDDAQTVDDVQNVGTDVSIIDDINPDISQPATVTDWANAGDLSASGPKVTGVSSVVVGAPICKSGRTTGWTCGTVSEAGGIFLVQGINYADDDTDLRAVRGSASTDLVGDEGDSGGAVISGTTAIGLTSAGGGGVSYTADLQTALAATSGYTVKIFVNAPVFATTEPVYRKGAITGTVAGAPAGTIVTVTIDGVTTDVTVGADGTFSVAAPNKFGTFPISAQAKSGFSSSAATKASVEVVKETLPAPVFTAPAADGTATAPVTSLTGTGTPGATITFDGDVTGTTVVAADGTWTKALDEALTPGEYTVTAAATLTDWNDSPVASSTFTVVLAQAGITTPADGTEFAFADAPTTVTGTNLDGATVTVTVDGVEYKATVTDGTWSIKLTGALEAGSHSVSVVQSLDGATSAATTSSFSVLAKPVPPVVVTPEPTVNPVPAGHDPEELANTGATAMTLGGLGALLLVGGTTFLLMQRRRSHV